MTQCQTSFIAVEAHALPQRKVPLEFAGRTYFVKRIGIGQDNFRRDETVLIGIVGPSGASHGISRE